MTRLLVIFTTVAIVAIGAATRAADAPSPCSATVERSAQLSASQLFDAVMPCAGEKRPFETTLPFSRGTDSRHGGHRTIELLPAKSDADKLVAAQLYGRIFYQMGGAGDSELYRDPTLTQKLFERIEVWVADATGRLRPRPEPAQAPPGKVAVSRRQDIKRLPSLTPPISLTNPRHVNASVLLSSRRDHAG